MRKTVAAGAAALVICGAAFAEDAPSATGRVYIYRPSDEVQVVLPVWVDGQRIQPVIEHGACIFVDLPPGPHRIHTMSEHDASIDLKTGDEIYVMLDGETQHVTLGSMDGGYIDTVTPTIVPSSKGKSAAGDCKAAGS